MTPTERHALYQSTLDDLTRTTAALATVAREDAERQRTRREKWQNAGFLGRLVMNPFLQGAAVFGVGVLLTAFAIRHL